MPGFSKTLWKILRCVEKRSFRFYTNAVTPEVIKDCKISRHLRGVAKTGVNFLTLCGILLGNRNKCDLTSEIVHYITMAEIVMSDCNFQLAEILLRKTLTLAKDGGNFNGIVYAYEVLAAISADAGKIEDAVEFLKSAIEFLTSQGISEDDNFMVNVKLNLSRLYERKGDDNAADLSYRHCLTVQKQSVTYKGDGDTLMLLASILYWYGKFMVNKGKFKEAKSYFEDCCFITKQLDFAHPNQLVLVLYNLGEVCHVLGEFDNALKYFADAFKFGKYSLN